MESANSKHKNKRVFRKINEILSHNTSESLWLLIDSRVYDVTSFKHPGGKAVLIKEADQDASKAFKEKGHSQKAYDMLEDLQIGVYQPDKDDAPYPVQKQQAEYTLGVRMALLAVFIATAVCLYSSIKLNER
jgi:cytochrome b involved in lipid metabolism